MPYLVEVAPQGVIFIDRNDSRTVNLWSLNACKNIHNSKKKNQIHDLETLRNAGCDFVTRDILSGYDVVISERQLRAMKTTIDQTPLRFGHFKQRVSVRHGKSRGHVLDRPERYQDKSKQVNY